MFNAVRIVAGSPITVIVNGPVNRPPVHHQRSRRPVQEVRRGDDPHRRPVPTGDLHRLRARAPQLLHRVQHPSRRIGFAPALEPHRQPRPPTPATYPPGCPTRRPAASPPPTPPAAPAAPERKLPLTVLQRPRCPAAAAPPASPGPTGSAPDPPAASPPTSDPSTSSSNCTTSVNPSNASSAAIITPAELHPPTRRPRRPAPRTPPAGAAPTAALARSTVTAAVVTRPPPHGPPAAPTSGANGLNSSGSGASGRGSGSTRRTAGPPAPPAAATRCPSRSCSSLSSPPTYARNRCRRIAATLPKIRTPSTTTTPVDN